jgi:hypothetical protein
LESELQDSTLTQQRCINVDIQQWNLLLDSSSNTPAASDFRSITVDSCNKEIGTYCFYDTVLAIDDEQEAWFGYRALGCSTFSEFCGIGNFIHVGSPTTKREFNAAASPQDVAEYFKPVQLLQHFSYQMPEIEKLPTCYTTVPFMSRDAEDDTPITDPMTFVAEVQEVPQSENECEEDELTEGEDGPPPTQANRGSSPLADISNVRIQTPRGPSQEDTPITRPDCGRKRVKKRARRSCLIDDEADASSAESADSEQVSPNSMHCNHVFNQT